MTATKREVDLIFFDLDGTLADTGETLPRPSIIPSPPWDYRPFPKRR